MDANDEANKLRDLRTSIADLLSAADVCAVVTLAGRGGTFESFYHWDASWSCVRLEPVADVDGRGDGEVLRFSSHFRDYANDRALQHTHMAWTAGVVRGFGELTANQALPLLAASAQIDGEVGATHTPLERTDRRGTR